MSDTAALAAPADPGLRLRRALFPPARPGSPVLYCVIDAARDRRIHSRLRSFAVTEEIAALYDGPAAIEMAAVAPYLLRMPRRGAMFSWLWEEGWGHAWGIFLQTTATMETLRAHLRRLTTVRSENGQTMLFRFYDPRVLSVFLPTCDAGQVAEIFGPVDALLMEGPSGATLERFAQQAGKLQRGHLQLF